MNVSFENKWFIPTSIDQFSKKEEINEENYKEQIQEAISAIEDRIVNPDVVRSIVNFCVENEKWNDLEAFIVECCKKEPDSETYFDLKAEVVTTLIDFFQNVDDYVYEATFVPTNMGVALKALEGKNSFFNPSTSKQVPVFPLEISCQPASRGEADVFYIQNTLQVEAFKETLRNQSSHDCALLVKIPFENNNNGSHVFSLYIQKRAAEVRVYMLDSLGRNIPLKSLELLKPLIAECVQEKKITFFVSTTKLQNDGETCFAFAVKSLSYFIKYPAMMKWTIDAAYSNSSEQVAISDFEIDSPKILRLMQSCTKLRALHCQLPDHKRRVLNFENLKSKHFKEVDYNGDKSEHNYKALHHGMKYEIMIWNALFNACRNGEMRKH